MPTKKQPEPTPKVQVKEKDIASIYEEKTKEVIESKVKTKVPKNGNTITTS